MGNIASRDADSVPVTLLRSSTTGKAMEWQGDEATGRALVNSVASSGVTSINADTTAAQIIAVGTGLSIADNGTGTHTVSFTSTTGSGAVVLATSPTLVTPALGVASATSLGVAGIITTGVNGGTNGSVTFSGSTSGSTVLQANVAAGGTVTLPASSGTLALTSQLTSGTVTSVSVVSTNGFAGTVATATTTPAITLTTSITGILQGNGTAISAATTTGSGSVVLATSPTLITPVLGVATATSINKVTLTAPATSATLTIADGKTLAVNDSTTLANASIVFANGKTLSVSNSLTLAGTDSTVMTFPSTTATIARTDAAQTFTGTQTFSQTILTANAITATINAATIPVTSGRNIVTNSSAATLTITLTTTSAVNMQTCVVQILDFSAVAQTLILVNTENSTVSPPASTNGSTTLPLTLGFIFNSATTKWRLVASA